jgi:uncharacterized membrane protein
VTAGPPGYPARMIGAEWFYIVFRIFHIGAGVAWVGSVYFLVVFVQPTSAAIGPAAAPFMTELLGARRLVDRILVLATATILAGLILYLKDMNAVGGFGDWIGSSQGLVFTIGGLAAIGAVVIGAFGTRPAVQRLLAIGREVAQAPQSGGAPPVELTAQVPVLQARMKILARASFVLLVVAVIAMSTARYW